MKNSRGKGSVIFTVRKMILSTAILFTSLLAPSVIAHELQPAIANLTVSNNVVKGEIELSLEPIIIGMDLEAIENTDDAPEAQKYDALRSMIQSDLRPQFDQAWPNFRSKLKLLAGTTSLDIQLDEVTIPPLGNIELTRVSKLSFSAKLPADNSGITFGWTPDLGSLIVRQKQSDGQISYAAFLSSGSISAPMPREGTAIVAGFDNFVNYIVIGFEHIIPKGLDHILFVLGLFFFSLKMRPLLLQITAFTLAHTVTLAMATAGLVSVPPSIIEPLIALSIAFVALENIKGGNITYRRTAIVFAFGLLHGLGFASVLGDVGLEPSKFISSLIAFNIGVELGQLSVILIAFITLGLAFGKKPWYRKFIAIPSSILIAIVGLYWTVERIFF
jgi:hypothetical protein